MKLYRDHAGALIYLNENKKFSVRVQRCFPWGSPQTHLSLRDAKNEEVDYLTSLDNLDPGSMKALLMSLQESQFCFDVTKIKQVEEQVELRFYEVETEQGLRTFHTKLNSWPKSLPGNGLLFTDVYGDFYLIRDLQALDEDSQKMLWAFID